MALSFLPQSNLPGTLCYIIYGSHPNDAVQAQDFQATINEQHPNKVVLFEHNSREARGLIDFFSLTDLRYPVLLIVREDDSLAYQWSTTLPTPEDLMYHLHQIGD